MTAIIAAVPEPHLEAGAERHGWKSNTAFDHLEKLGVGTHNHITSWDGYVWPGDEDDPEASPWPHRAIHLSWEQADILIWNQVAHDLGIAPQAPVQSKLVDLNRGVSVYVYDNRGMDVTSLDPNETAELYSEFDDWLLDYDRERMSKAYKL